MNFLIAESFTAALTRLTGQEQKQAKTAAFDLQLNPAQPGLQMHRLTNSRDPNFWSVRVNQDIRIIVHKTEASFMLAYVDHHDKAYAWAERRRIEAHPRTGAIQIVEVHERIEEVGPLFAPIESEAKATPVEPIRPPRLVSPFCRCWACLRSSRPQSGANVRSRASRRRRRRGFTKAASHLSPLLK